MSNEQVNLKTATSNVIHWTLIVVLLAFIVALCIGMNESHKLIASNNVKYDEVVSKLDCIEQDKQDYILDQINSELEDKAFIRQRVTEWVMRNSKNTIPISILDDTITEVLKYDRWKLIFAVISVESNFDPFAKSGKNAGGLMQVMYSVWHVELDIPTMRDIYDVHKNISYGNAVLDTYLKATDGDVGKALYKYVGGDSSYQKKVLVKYAELDFFINSGTKVVVDEPEIDISVITD